MITFALALVPMLFIVGSATDYSRAVAQRSNLQQATDATALAIAHAYLLPTSNAASMRAPTQTYLAGSMYGATLVDLTLSNNNSQICISTTFVLPTTIMAMTNIKTMTVHADACASTNTATTYEVALALDNSGSMSETAGGLSKIAALKVATQSLVDILNPAGTTNPTAAISLVPFSGLVNVGTSQTASFLDTTGQSSIHWQNFHRPAATALAPFYPKSKLDLFSAMRSASWSGCVEERPTPYITTDTAATTGKPDTLFVPFLSPDDPGDTSYNGCFYINPSTKAVSSSCTNAGSGSLQPHYFYNSYLSDSGAANLSAACLANPLSATMDAVVPPLTPSDNQPNTYPLGGATMVCKYNGGKPVTATQGTITTGPNYLCTTPPISQLTTDRTVLASAVTAMQASGSTNLATGFMWAWRTISPTVNPFPVTSPTTIGPQNPKSYAQSTSQQTSAPNQKFIILMTDGYNSWTSNPYSPWLSLYEAFGYYVNNRIAAYGDCTNSGSTLATDASSFRCQMDNVTQEACTNAKKAGITIYTVGFTIASDPIDAQGIKLLQNCASSSANYFQASTGDGIVAAFTQIAQNIQKLRLTQ